MNGKKALPFIRQTLPTIIDKTDINKTVRWILKENPGTHCLIPVVFLFRLFFEKGLTNPKKRIIIISNDS